MEKIKVTKDNIDEAVNNVKFLRPLPCSVAFDIAKELAERCVVLNDEGACYEDYRFPVVFGFLYLKHASNLDVDEMSSEEDMFLLYDKISKEIPEEYDEENMIIFGAYDRLRDALYARHRRINSLDYIAGKYVKELRESSVSDAVALSEKLINLTKEIQESDTDGNTINFSMFAKK